MNGVPRASRPMTWRCLIGQVGDSTYAVSSLRFQQILPSGQGGHIVPSPLTHILRWSINQLHNPHPTSYAASNSIKPS